MFQKLRHWYQLRHHITRHINHHGRNGVGRMLLCAVVIAGSLILGRFYTLPVHADSNGTIQFSFTLDTTYHTSAGVYKPDGTLVRTIWSNTVYSPGTHTATWDGLDDSGNAAPAGPYQVRVLINNVKYEWDGVIGNTSTSYTNDVWRTLSPGKTLAFSDTTGYMSMGYNEGHDQILTFATNNPQVPSGLIHQDTAAWYGLLATDGTLIYGTYNPGVCTYDTNDSTFVVAFNTSDGSEHAFADGTDAQTATPWNDDYPGSLDVHQEVGHGACDQPFITAHIQTGLAVQKTGNLLAVAHSADNQILLFDKTSGASEGTISLTTPGALSFDSNGDLWVVSGTNAYRYTDLSTTPTLAATISGLTDPVNIAVDPTNANKVLVMDSGASQQIKAFDTNGGSLWTYGTLGGYALNGPDVTNSMFSFGTASSLAFQSDGTFWVQDGLNNRYMHFDANHNYLNEIAFNADGAVTSVDAADPTRVFTGFKEYQVDYSQPLQPGDPGGSGAWKLVKNWAGSLPAAYTADGYPGISMVTQLSNGRTYGVIDKGDVNSTNEIVELTNSGLRLTGIMLSTYPESSTLYPDGSIRTVSQVSNGMQTLTMQVLSGFDGSGNPQWAAPTTVATWSATTKTPYYQTGEWSTIQGPLFPETSSGVFLSLNSTDSLAGASVDTGMHLGGVKQGSTDWFWQASPALENDVPFDEKGSFDIGDGSTYAANAVMTAGNTVVYGFHGEFWNGSEADQFMNFNDDGLVVGQFGTPGDITSILGLSGPGQGGNELNPALIKAANGETYLYTSDESTHAGINRWHLVGINDVREFTGTATLNSTLALTPPVTAYPTGIEAHPGNTQVALTWQPVAGASSYSVKMSTNSGGPYTTLASSITSTSYIATGLTNDTAYYFVLSATTGGVESVNSDERMMRPVDPTVTAQIAGQYASLDDEKVVNIVSANVGTSTAPYSLLTSENILGNMSRTDLGTEGFEVFDAQGVGDNTSKFVAGASVTISGSGWDTNNNNTASDHNFEVDGTSEAASQPGVYGNYLHYTMSTNGPASITVDPGDNNWHYVTLYSNTSWGNPVVETLDFTPVGGSSPALTTTIDQSTAPPPGPGAPTGYNLYQQYLIKGPTVISWESGAQDAQLQVLFLDPADVDAPIGPGCAIATPSSLAAGDQSNEGVTLYALDALGNVTATESNVLSDPDGVLDVDPTFAAALSGASSIRVKVPGFLSESTPASASGDCYTIPTKLLPGDFNDDNKLTLTDLVTGIRSYNGGGTAPEVTDAYKKSQLSLQDLVGLIHTYNNDPNGN